MESIFFDGPEGQLEGLLVLRESRMGAVLCHPHPLYGGSMHDTLLGSLHTAIASQNCSTLRFNFRGVGSSDGDHDKGDGEVSDLVAAVDYLHSKGSGEIILAGYSFGAAMCLKAESRKASCDGVGCTSGPDARGIRGAASTLLGFAREGRSDSAGGANISLFY